MTTTRNPMLEALAKAMKQLGIPEQVETKEQTHKRLNEVITQLLAPYHGRPMILVQAQAMCDLQAINLLLLCFLFPENSAAKEMFNLLHENLLEELSDPSVRQAIADSHHAAALARGRP